VRIVAGKHRGRPLMAPAGSAVRPTSDRARESVFNILVHGIADFTIEGASVVDVFAGTGALGLEALSRGARHATFVDADPAVLHVVRQNAARIGEWRAVTLLRLDATRLPPPALAVKAPCRLAFLDPPYGQGLVQPALAGLASRGWLEKGAVVVAEIGAQEPFEPPKGFVLVDERTYGAARVLFLRYGA
jgi:16S rRNA (guanine966-N2)-methyltransferase